MSDDNKDKPKKNGGIGYGNPPKHSQFKKGKSGNPRGRKKREPANKLSDIYDILPRVLGELITPTIDGKKRTISIFEAVLLATGRKAASGNLGAAKMILEMVKEAPRDLKDEDTMIIRITDEDRKVIAQFMEDAESYGVSPDRLDRVAEEYGIERERKGGGPDEDDDGEPLGALLPPPDKTH